MDLDSKVAGEIEAFVHKCILKHSKSQSLSQNVVTSIKEKAANKIQADWCRKKRRDASVSSWLAEKSDKITQLVNTYIEKYSTKGKPSKKENSRSPSPSKKTKSRKPKPLSPSQTANTTPIPTDSSQQSVIISERLAAQTPQIQAREPDPLSKPSPTRAPTLSVLGGQQKADPMTGAMANMAVEDSVDSFKDVEDNFKDEVKPLEGNNLIDTKTRTERRKVNFRQASTVAPLFSKFSVGLGREVLHTDDANPYLTPVKDSVPSRPDPDSHSEDRKLHTYRQFVKQVSEVIPSVTVAKKRTRSPSPVHVLT